MSMLTIAELETLALPQKHPCVSIFLPTYPTGPMRQQGPIRLKNHVTEAEERLVQQGLRSSEARELLAPARELVHQQDFWLQQSDGLAVYVAPEFFRHYMVPLQFPDLVVISDTFQLKPLLPLLVEDGRYFVLALDQKDARIYEGTRYSIHEVTPQDLPNSLNEALKYDLLEKQLQFHTRAGERAGWRAAMYYGHGAGGEVDKERLQRYFRLLDTGLHDLLREERAPLVLAGVEYYFPIYHEVNTYPHLLPGGIPRSPDGMTPEDLQHKAWELLQPVFQQERETDSERFGAATAAGLASNDVADVALAAREGRVEVLFVDPDVQQWGQFQPENYKFELHAEPQPGDVELLDHAAMQTLLKKGTVYPGDPATIPGHRPVAALYRY